MDGEVHEDMEIAFSNTAGGELSEERRRVVAAVAERRVVLAQRVDRDEDDVGARHGLVAVARARSHQGQDGQRQQRDRGGCKERLRQLGQRFSAQRSGLRADHRE